MLKGKLPRYLRHLIKEDPRLLPDVLLAYKEYKAMVGFPHGNGAIDILTCHEASELEKVLSGAKRLSSVIPFNDYKPGVVCPEISRRRLKSIEKKLFRPRKVYVPKLVSN